MNFGPFITVEYRAVYLLVRPRLKTKYLIEKKFPLTAR